MDRAEWRRAAVPGRAASRTDSPGRTCRWRCQDPAAGEPCAPRRRVSVEDSAVTLVSWAYACVTIRAAATRHLTAPPPRLLGAQLLLQVLDESVFGALDVFVCGAGGRRPRGHGLLQDGFGKTGGEKHKVKRRCRSSHEVRLSKGAEGNSPLVCCVFI